MFYSSGTTGQPKGIKPPTIGGELGAPTSFAALVAGLYGFSEESVYLCPAPLYHAAPAGWTNAVHRLRSEEHTSELQSLMRISYAVFCLKKKTSKNERTWLAN